jgi:hypothetical protein
LTVLRDLVLPVGSRLVHIGPHKTGTTTVQGAFCLARDRLADHGVVYASGGGRAPMQAALAVTGKPEMWGEPPAGTRHWDALLDEVAAAGERRVVVSTEFFADGDQEAAQRVVDGLGGSRAHVVVTLRPLTKILPSQWQQYLQNGLRAPYDKWLDEMFNRPPFSPPTPTFWGRHRHDQLVERWAAAAGPEHVTVVVVDESDPQLLLRAFESMVDLPEGFLVPEDTRANRSLTLGEAELVRLVNEAATEMDMPKADYAKYLRYGAVQRMKAVHRPGPDEPRISTPRWALEKAVELGAEMAAKISRSGVRVVGDISVLHQLPDDAPAATDEAPPAASTLATAAAAQAVLGAVQAGTTANRRPQPKPKPKPKPRPKQKPRPRSRPVEQVDAMSLARILLRRARRRAERLVSRLWK